MPRKQLQGVVISLSGEKTAKVQVSRQWQHPLYKKRVSRTKNYACHFDQLKLVVGDEVVIEECRPVSKTKRFRIINKINKTK